MDKLSVVIITYNEQHNIERCLKSVLSVADEIVILDSFSEDNTCAIARQYGAQIYTQKWLGYAESKNVANSKAHYDWILSLDADEALSEPLQESITTLKQQKLTTASFKRLTNYCGSWIKHTGWYPDIKLRLFNREFMYWKGHIHETLCTKDHKAVKPILLKGDCYHYSYYTIDEHRKQAAKFSLYSAQDMFQRKVPYNVVKAFFAPALKFLEMYFYKLGWLDGYYGFIISKISAHAAGLKYTHLKKFYREASKDSSV